MPLAIAVKAARHKLKESPFTTQFNPVMYASEKN
jgi:hypothetical protein